MRYEIANDTLSVSVDTMGGELASIRKDGLEYLWQGDPKYWTSRAPNLFPIIGRLADGQYTYRGETYRMKQHGFVRDTEMELYAITKDTVAFRLRPDERTRAEYPFDFTYRVFYMLEGNRIRVRYRVRNKGFQPLIFSVGGHPGFRVPLEEGLSFEDYRLEFSAKKPVKRVVLSDRCLPTGEEASFALEDGRILPLTHALFDRDAIVLKDTSGSVRLGSEKGSRAVTVDYPDMKYVGFWHKPKTDAPYVCIEPWTSLPSYEGKPENLETKPDMIVLQSGEIYRNEWAIAVE